MVLDEEGTKVLLGPFLVVPDLVLAALEAQRKRVIDVNACGLVDPEGTGYGSKVELKDLCNVGLCWIMAEESREK